MYGDDLLMENLHVKELRAVIKILESISILLITVIENQLEAQTAKTDFQHSLCCIFQ